MKIQFKKGKNGVDILSYTRNDDTSGWSKMFPNFVIHDLAHYVVESNLNIQNGFFGLLNQGYDPADFEKPKNQRPEAVQVKNLPPESIVMEHLVNLVLTDFQNKMTDESFLNSLEMILKKNDLPLVKNLDKAALAKIRKDLQTLDLKWKSLPEKGILEFELW